MSIHRLKDKPHGKARKLPWRAVVSRKNQKPLIKQFSDRQEAILWEAERRKEQRLQDVPEFRRAKELENLRKLSVRDLIFDYIKQNPKLGTTDIISLNQFSRESICSKSVLDFSRQDVHRWIEKKKKQTWKPPGTNGEAKPITPRTVRRQANIVQRVFQWAIESKEGFTSFSNPFRDVRIVGSTGGRRERSLEGAELQLILNACKKCLGENKFYVPLAIHLAIDTGMRRQEIFNLICSDIDVEHRRIKIRKQKTDKAMGRTNCTSIVLPITTIHWLTVIALERFMNDDEKYDAIPWVSSEERLFPMTELAFTQVWKKVLRRAGIKDLHFHDLRRSANTRFIMAGLTVEERNIMLRHADKSMNAIYIGRQFLLDQIQKKLDKFEQENKQGEGK
jgi:integrase